MSMSVAVMNIYNGDYFSRASLEARTKAVGVALDKFFAANGYAMIEFRDCPHREQSKFWRDIWWPLLAKHVEKGLVLVQMLGPLCNQRAHSESPAPDFPAKALPTGFDTDDVRARDALEDLCLIFSEEGFSESDSLTSANVHLAQNLGSVDELHSRLTTVLWKMRANKRTSI